MCLLASTLALNIAAWSGILIMAKRAEGIQCSANGEAVYHPVAVTARPAQQLRIPLTPCRVLLAIAGATVDGIITLASSGVG